MTYYVPEWEKEFQELLDKQKSAELEIDKKLEEPIISTGRIGMTITEGQHAGGDFIKTLASAARKGATKVELALNQQAGIGYGAEGYGKTKRQELKELSFATGVEISSIHVPTEYEGFSGVDIRNERISEEKIQHFMKKVENALKFAADTMPKKIDSKNPTDGISIVVHVGEFPGQQKIKPLQEVYEEEEKKFGKFVVYKDNPYFLVDTETKRIISFSENLRVPLALENFKLENGKIQFFEPWENGKPVVETFSFGDFKKVCENLKNSGIEYIKKAEDEKYQALAAKIANLAENLKEKGIIKNENEVYEKPHWVLMLLSNEKEEKEALSKIKEMEREYEEILLRIKKIEEYKRVYQQFIEYGKKAGQLDDPAFRALLTVQRKLQTELHPIPLEEIQSIEYLEKLIKDLKTEASRRYEAMISFQEELKRLEERKKKIKPLEDYALEKSINTLAQMGLKAMEYTQKNNLSKPLYIAPENWVPESGFGSHPEELLFLVKEARKKMTEMLTSPTIEVNGQKINNPYYIPDKNKAEELAKQHIKLTLDTEHLALWKNYFLANNPQKSDEAFIEWFKEKVEKLIKENVIGNVHLVDSFGGHSQLPPGEGELPLKEMVKKLIEAGYKGPISSEGFGDPDEQLFAAWRNIANAVYFRANRGVSWQDIDWDNVYHKYRVGEYGHNLYLIPSEDWKFWSGLSLN